MAIDTLFTYITTHRFVEYYIYIVFDMLQNPATN